ncbi:MAG: hypothetical protein H0U57_13095 [Tatlockia sp.]|nr:hypothetical protein [Tatlockia sp.]
MEFKLKILVLLLNFTLPIIGFSKQLTCPNQACVTSSQVCPKIEKTTGTLLDDITSDILYIFLTSDRVAAQFISAEIENGNVTCTYGLTPLVIRSISFVQFEPDSPPGINTLWFMGKCTASISECTFKRRGF